MKNLKIKIITGFRRDQHHTISAEEAHKAYYLFLNPEQRGVFKNGIALRGVDIQTIVPDYHATMGWNATHELDSYDMNEIRDKGIDTKIRHVLSEAKMIAQNEAPEKMNLPLSALLEGRSEQKFLENV